MIGSRSWAGTRNATTFGAADWSSSRRDETLGAESMIGHEVGRAALSVATDTVIPSEQAIERGLQMSNENRRHVVPNEKGGWDVKKPGSDRSSGHTDTQKQAQDRAREIVRKAGGGEVKIHGRDGKIRDSDTVAPGNDPNPPRDKK